MSEGCIHWPLAHVVPLQLNLRLGFLYSHKGAQPLFKAAPMSRTGLCTNHYYMSRWFAGRDAYKLVVWSCCVISKTLENVGERNAVSSYVSFEFSGDQMGFWALTWNSTKVLDQSTEQGSWWKTRHIAQISGMECLKKWIAPGFLHRSVSVILYLNI